MLNFTVGPVQSPDIMREIGAQQVPYFRTPEFSSVMLESERLMKEFVEAPDNSRAVFLTGSGTASMEAAVMNALTEQDKALVVNGGSFGARFARICEIHNIPYDEIRLQVGRALTPELLAPYDGRGYTCFIVNVHETSTGVLYDMNLISEFCKRNRLFLIADAISSFLADEFRMAQWGADIVMTGSQKALACPPGVSVMVLSEDAVGRVERNPVKCMYLDLKAALKDGERGQTPFTPAVGTLLQINARLKQIQADGGVEAERRKIAELARDFRGKIKDLPLAICSESLSNAVTPLRVERCSAYDVFTALKDEYDIWICPNGGELKDKIFRVGHIGFLTPDDNAALLDALHDLAKRGVLK